METRYRLPSGIKTQIIKLLEDGPEQNDPFHEQLERLWYASAEREQLLPILLEKFSLPEQAQTRVRAVIKEHDRKSERESMKVQELMFETNFGYHQPGGTIDDVYDTFGDLPGLRGD